MKEKTLENQSLIPREKVRLRLDGDVVNFFKSLENYEEIINEILREHMEAPAISTE